MKNKFNFLQIANWLYFSKKNLEQIKNNINQPDEEIKNNLKIEIKKLKILIEILQKKRNIYGINYEFLKNLNSIKKEYGIIE